MLIMLINNSGPYVDSVSIDKNIYCVVSLLNSKIKSGITQRRINGACATMFLIL